MPIEIKLFLKNGGTAEGTHKARYLNEPERGLFQDLNPCRKVQVIEGPNAGLIVHYETYIVVGELPAQAELLQVKEKLVNDLAAAGKKIAEDGRKIELLKELKATLEEHKARLSERAKALEKTNRELNAQIRPPETKLESRKEVRGAIGQIVWEWWRDSTASDDPRSQVQNLTDKIYSYFEKRNTRSF